MSRQGAREDAKGKKRSGQQTAAEWVLFAIAAAILLALVVGIVFLSLQPDVPATFRIETLAPDHRSGSYYLPITVTNTGNTTAADVQVVAEGSGVSAEKILPFLAPGEEENIVFVLPKDPRAAGVSVRVASYAHP